MLGKYSLDIRNKVAGGRLLWWAFEFLGIDENLVKVAATVSAPLNAGPDREELATWIQSLPEKEKNNLLVAAVSGPGERWKNGLLRRSSNRTRDALCPRRTQFVGALQAIS
jgi:hypothetical protein